MIPQFSETKNFSLTKDRLFAKLDDYHAKILDPEKVKESNLEIGDVIFKVNAKSITEIIDEFSQ
ncbi:hypothetical protein [Zunongwangia profunda]|uniref:hypothetical protein n=1 Tax=Zunongwangia profunda TaxID=398743 RepID=UPI0030DB67DE